MRTLFKAFTIAVITLAVPVFGAAQIPIPGIPHVPGLPTQLPVPPLVPASSTGVIAQPAQRLVRVDALDGFAPARYGSLADLSRDGEGVYALVPGAFELIDESFCLNVGAHAPGSDSSYFVGALTGDRSSYVRSVLQRWTAHPEIQQAPVQLLLWGILARANVSSLTGPPAEAARTLLTPQEIMQLNGGVLGLLRQSGVPLPAPVQQALSAESQVRDLLAHGNSSYQQIAAIAVSEAPPQPPAALRERWSYDPTGYFIRYLPISFPTTVVQIVYPSRYTILHDSSGRITEIADALGTRLDIAYTPSAQATLSIAPFFYASGNVIQRIPLGTLQAASSVSIASLQQFAGAVHASPAFAAGAVQVAAVTHAADALVQRSSVSFDKEGALNFLREALPYMMCDAAGACNGGQVASLDLIGLGPSSPTYNPPNNLGAPDAGDRQPLAQSGNPAPGDKNKDCDKMKGQLQFAQEYKQRYNDPNLVSAARQGNWTGQDFEDEVEKIANADAVRSGAPGIGFEIGAYTDGNCNSHFPSRDDLVQKGLPPYLLQVMQNHEAVHRADCNHDKQNNIPDTWQSRQSTENRAYDQSINTINQWLDQNCK